MTHSTEQIAKALDSININESEFLSDLGKQTDKTDCNRNQSKEQTHRR